MNWTGLLQNLLVVVHLERIACVSVRFSVPEELEAGTLAGTLGGHFPPPYQLLTQEYLWMDKNTGNFYITEQKMDREALCPEETKAEECIILLNALVGPSGDIIQFSVIIEDINDNAPHFQNNEIHLRLSEDVTIGTSFPLDDQAQDCDAGRNGELRYHLQGSDGVFKLRVENGPVIMLVVQTGLDREKQDRYQMELVAADRGAEPLSATATLVVTVTDVNDNCPSFGPDSARSVAIPGDSPRNTPVAQVSATDPDLGSNAAIVYSFSSKVSNRVRELFSLDSHSGHITLTRDLQSDRSEELLLRVLATGDHCPPAETQVTVSLLPKTNQAAAIKIGFIAEHQNQTVLLPENQPPTALAVLQLVGDKDVKDSFLRIEGDVPFILSPQSDKYLLSTSKTLDYELKSEYEFNVMANRRSGGGSAVTTSREPIRVLVVDVNDNTPRFLQSHYEVEVRENNQPGELLLKVSASDADGGENGRVSYRLGEHAASIFTMHRVTGQLSVSAPLDRERQDVHRFTVVAQDGGSPPSESEVTVSVRVLDQNDNAPVFVNHHFVFFIPENVPPFAQVGLIGVTDPDEGENGNVGLSLVNGSASFVVDNSKGALRSTTALDRETQDRYELCVLATDNGHPFALTSTARVTIFVEDVNDNQPKVILPNSNLSCLTISPATTAGTMVTTIYAVDEDSGFNSEITYTLAARDPAHHSSPFRLDSRSGNITVARRLQVEHMGMHHLFIVVRDGGKPAPLHTTVWVNLLVNETVKPCHLDRAPRSLPYTLAQTPTQAPICEMEEGSNRSAQLTLLVGSGMLLAAICLFVLTAVLYLKQRRRSPAPSKREEKEANQIPLRLRDTYYSE